MPLNQGSGEPAEDQSRAMERELPPPRKFMALFRSRTSACLSNSYLANHEIHPSHDGSLMTSLPAQVFFVVQVQVAILHEYVAQSGLSESEKDDFVVGALRFILTNLMYKQNHFRSNFLVGGLESCCAAANDFFRMSELVDEAVKQCSFLGRAFGTSRAQCLEFNEVQDLISTFTADAVFAAQMAHSVVFAPLHQSVENDLFGVQWEDNFTQNEVALKIVKTEEDFWEDIRIFLREDFLAKKLADVLVSRSVVFYIECLLKKARKQQDTHTSMLFSDPKRAVRRIFGDIQVMRSFFTKIAADYPALSRVIENEFSALVAVYECMSIAAGASEADVRDFAVVLHKITGDFRVTRSFLYDMWLTVAPRQAHRIWCAVTSMEVALCEIEGSKKTSLCESQHEIRGIRLDELLLRFYVDDDDFRRKCRARAPRDLIGRMKSLAARERLLISRQPDISKNASEMLKLRFRSSAIM